MWALLAGSITFPFLLPVDGFLGGYERHVTRDINLASPTNPQPKYLPKQGTKPSPMTQYGNDKQMRRRMKMNGSCNERALVATTVPQALKGPACKVVVVRLSAYLSSRGGLRGDVLGGWHLPPKRRGRRANACGVCSLIRRRRRRWNGLRPKKQTYFFHKSREIRKQDLKMKLWLATFPKRLAVAWDFLEKCCCGPRFSVRFCVSPRRGPIFEPISPQPAGAVGPRRKPEGMLVHTFGRGLEGMRIPSDLQNEKRRKYFSFFSIPEA